jgi:hypothetical protein
MLARDVLHAFVEQRWDELPRLLHPDAELEAGFAAPGARFGRHEVLDAAWVAASSGAYRPEYQFVESLDERTALVAVRIRLQIGTDLCSERDAAYLMTFVDGLLMTTRVFDSTEIAVAAHREQQGESAPA